jgi:putative PIN family toxin of toxin-antitoxin system
MKVVVDTSILVSAVLRDRLPEKVIAYLLAQADIIWIVTADIVAEYRQVLARPKFAVPPAELARQFALFDALERIEATVTMSLPRDSKDAKFLACAATANADYLITGDRDLLSAQSLVTTRIVGPAEFARLIGVAV